MDKVLVVDLDGTLYRCNTFHQFLKYLFYKYLKQFRLLKIIPLKLLVTLRLCRLVSHKYLKYKVLMLLKDDTLEVQPFLDYIAKYKVKIPELSDTTFTYKILATAAPECYAQAIAKAHNFDACLATKTPTSDYTVFFENIKENKRHSLQNHLKTQGLQSIDTLITDHIDDSYIAVLAQKTVVYNPNNRFGQWLKENFINFEERFS